MSARWGSRRARPQPVPAPALPPGPKGSAADLAVQLAAFGAIRFAIPRGYWCYVLIDASGLPVYVGITGNLLRRLGEHLKAYGLRIAQIQVIKARTEHEARVTQLFLADRFEAGIENFLGTAEYERYRAELHRAARAMDLPAFVTARHEAMAAGKSYTGISADSSG